MSVRRLAARLGLALLVSTAVATGVGTPTLAAETPQTYVGPGYTSQIVRPPTGSGDQSKVWFHADAWWALLVEPQSRTVRVFELMPDHTWRPTSALVNPDAIDSGDALPDGDGVHVVTRRTDGTLHYVRLAFDPATRDYTAGPSVLVTDRGPRAPAMIVEDTIGRLWVAYATATDLGLAYSDDGGVTWVENPALAPIGLGSQPESVSLVAYDDRVGVLWSDRATGTFEFASHRDVDDPLLWLRERAREGLRVGGHISLRRIDGDPQDTLVAAVKTSPGDLGELPESVLIEVLVRRPDGTWSPVPVSTVADGLDEPVLQVDTTTRTLHVFAAANGDIVSKQASLDDIRFDAGPGRLFVIGAEGILAEPTVAKAPVDARTGRVVLASDVGSLTYRHAEGSITPPAPVVDPNDTTPPTTPEALRGHAESFESVVLSWAEANDGNRWVPTRNGVPVQGYVVLRDGVELATVTTTFFRDDPRGEGADASRDLTLRYEVVAVDAAGNRSPPTEVTVEVPGGGFDRQPSIVGFSLLGLAVVAGLLALRRGRLTQAMTIGTPAGRTQDGDRDPAAVGGRPGPPAA